MEPKKNTENNEALKTVDQKELMRKRKEAAIKRRNEIAKLVVATMGLNIPYEALSQEYGVCNMTIRRDVEYILRDTPRPDMGEYGMKILWGFENAFRTANNMMISPDKKDRAEGVRLFNDTVKANSEFLVRHGFLKQTEEGLIIANTSNLPVHINIIERQQNVQINQSEISMLPQEIRGGSFGNKTSHNNNSPMDKDEDL